ncbi:hypothetical protein [Antarcticibacterium flavum]|uniref:hypothetical protein n=1 Tax=Antarcticibacterium flavum TaxID=2058175 RepID=UPI001FE66AAF|nr:hypothetical protein [Antarcticibacterium flavum]
MYTALSAALWGAKEPVPPIQVPDVTDPVITPCNSISPASAQIEKSSPAFMILSENIVTAVVPMVGSQP